MTRKTVTVEFVFEEVKEFEDDDYVENKLVSIHLGHSDLTDGELDALGEEIGQSDTWQVDRWNDIQSVLGGTNRAVVYK